MAVKRYVGDKLVGPEAELDQCLNTVSEGATFYSTSSPYRVYIKKDNDWQQISAATASGTSGSSGTSGTSGSSGTSGTSGSRGADGTFGTSG